MSKKMFLCNWKKVQLAGDKKNNNIIGHTFLRYDSDTKHSKG